MRVLNILKGSVSNKSSNKYLDDAFQQLIYLVVAVDSVDWFGIGLMGKLVALTKVFGPSCIKEQR